MVQDVKIPLPNYHKEDGFHAEATAIENLTDSRRRENTIATQVVSQLAADRHDDGHHQVRKSRQSAHLFSIKRLNYNVPFR